VPRPTVARRWLLRAVVAVFYVAVVAMLVAIGRELDWPAAAAALDALPLRAVLTAAVCSAVCYALYAGYELLAARQVGVALPRGQVAAIGFASYACNLSLGAMLGALGLRLRLYTSRGIPAGAGVRLVAFNLLTNWSGYLLVLGAALLLMRTEPPPAWRVGAPVLQVLGAVLVVLAAGYAYACARARRRRWRLRGLAIELPTLRTALRQFALSVPAWLASAASLHALLPAADFDLLLVSLLGSAVIGLVVRVPAGLGVIEAVFLGALGGALGEGPVLASLLAYRCVHYLGPLVLGLLTFVLLDLAARRAAGSGRPAGPVQVRKAA